MNKAVFLDRDGTINEDVGDLYSLDMLKFIPKALDAIRLLQKEYQIFIITNQSGIGKKNFSLKQFKEFNKKYLEILQEEGIEIKEVYFCPHTEEDGCICRKPKTYFIDSASGKYGLDLKYSYIIGDHPSDAELGRNSGMKSIFLLTGHGKHHLKEMAEKKWVTVSGDIYEAALFILGRLKKSL